MAKEKQEKDLETGIKADASVDAAVEQKQKKQLVFPTLLRNLRMNN